MNFTSCLVEPNPLVIYSLASIHFEFLLLAHESLFHYIVQSNVKPCNRFEISHISSPPTTVSHFLHYLVVDQLYTKKVYFCSFVTKSNQATTKYSQYVFSMLYRTITHRGPSHRILTSLPLRQHFPIFHYRTSSFCCLPVSFFIAALQVPSPPNPLSVIYKISIGPDKPPHTLFFCFKKNYFLEIAPFSPLAGTPPKAHAVPIDLDIPPLRELGLQRIYL